MMKKYLKKLGRPITHRQIPLQIGLDFPTYDKKIIYHGEIEDQFRQPLIYDFEKDFSSPEWLMRDLHTL